MVTGGFESAVIRPLSKVAKPGLIRLRLATQQSLLHLFGPANWQQHSHKYVCAEAPRSMNMFYQHYNSTYMRGSLHGIASELQNHSE